MTCKWFIFKLILIQSRNGEAVDGSKVVQEDDQHVTENGHAEHIQQSGMMMFTFHFYNITKQVSEFEHFCQALTVLNKLVYRNLKILCFIFSQRLLW